MGHAEILRSDALLSSAPNRINDSPDLIGQFTENLLGVICFAKEAAIQPPLNAPGERADECDQRESCADCNAIRRVTLPA